MRTYTVISPGRVNIIGEHVDHQNYPVFPCAIKQAIKCEVSQYSLPEDREVWESTPALDISHELHQQYPSITFKQIADIKIEKNQHHWYNYLIASYFGIVEYLHYHRSLENGHTIDRHQGIPTEWYQHNSVDPLSPLTKKYKLRITTNGEHALPQAAGLSSSSALTCAGSLSYLVVPLSAGETITYDREGYSPVTDKVATSSAKYKLGLTRKEIAHVSAHGEGYSGTASGGMDQAAICLSQRGKALLINFHPLRSEAYALPRELEIVIADTGKAAPKAVSSAKMYNKRVFELKCACYIILKKHHITLKPAELVVNGLRDVLQMIHMSEDQFMKGELNQCLQSSVYTREDILKEVDEETRTFLLAKRCGVEVWRQNDDFHCYQRVRHVLTENQRVLRLVELCKQYGGAEQTPENVLIEIGALLDGSFESLSGDFDCGCEELTQLCGICKKAGAYGSRLTGAGWGGCTISLVHKDRVTYFIKSVEQQCAELQRNGRLTIKLPNNDTRNLDKILFVTEPSNPASVLNYC